MMRIGFTGTQAGMTAPQRWQIAELLRTAAVELHHGDCIGADCEAHALAIAYRRRVVIHPPISPSKRAWCQGAAEILDPSAYLARNRDIVDATERLIATPQRNAEELRSGTWSTVRYARKLYRPITIIRPDGTWLSENT